MLEAVPIPWWVSGGWAIDLWLGRTSRAHADFDVGCRRDSVRQFVDALEGWDGFRAHGGELESLTGAPDLASGSVWLKRSDAPTWDLQLMPEDVVADAWRYRRDRRIVAPVRSITWRTSADLLVLRPEIQLLYKAKDVRPKDQADFDEVAPTLDRRSQHWLSTQLRATAPRHPWLTHLSAATDI